ncbi:MAG: glycosyltransferase family 4 protein, partial [Anaerolineales bacterium]|nr:glycosyltransferase family 4 protein [Anaerolineales bacterium]
MSSKRIVIAGDFPLDPPNVVGGIQAVIYFTLTELAAYSDLEIFVVTCEKWGAAGLRKSWIQQARDWTTYYLPSTPLLPHTWTMLTTDRRNVARTIRQLRPDLIHAHGQVAAYPWAGFDSGFPTVVTVHGINALEAQIDRRGGRWRGALRAWLWNQVERACLRRAQDLVIISPFVAEVVKPVSAARLHWIENPVQPDLFELNHEQRIPGRILYVGSIQKRKGLLDLISTVDRLRDRLPEVHLHVAGEFLPAYAAYGDQVRWQVKKRALEDKIIFLGHLDRKALLHEYQRCAVFCLPSYLEASPVVVAEAMAAGCPVVTTDIASTAHLVRSGENGFRVPSGDVECLADILELVLKDPLLQKRLGLVAQEIAKERFTPSRAA